MVTFIVVVNQGFPVRLAVHLPAVVKLELLSEVELLHLFAVSHPSLQRQSRKLYHLFVYTFITLLPADVWLASLQICPNKAKLVNMDIDW